MEALQAFVQAMVQQASDADARVLRIAALALKASTIPYAQRRIDIAERVGITSDAWPAKRLITTAVDCESGRLTTFDATSGVSLIDAVAASCAVPGVWPVTPIKGRLYMDGGVWRTAENAHLSKGARRIIIVAPAGSLSSSAAPSLKDDIAMLERHGALVTLITPDEKLDARKPNTQRRNCGPIWVELIAIPGRHY